MRINKYIARSTGLSRRTADQAVGEGRVHINQKPADPGADVSATDTVTLDGQPLALPAETTTIMLNKPAGYVCSRNGQGSRTIYELLPPELHHLKSVGRLDKDSSGLILLTSDGGLANQLTHPRYTKEKVYEVQLNKLLSQNDKARIEEGVKLDDGPSRLQIKNLEGNSFTVTMAEGRNRQIRRTFEALGYHITKLHRTTFGSYHLDKLALKEWKQVY